MSCFVKSPRQVWLTMGLVLSGVLAFSTTVWKANASAASHATSAKLPANGGAANFSYAGLTSLTFDPTGVQGYELGGALTGDFNGDGLTDIVTASGSLGKAYLFLRNAALNPPFDAPQELSGLTGNDVSNPRSADFNEDGNPDLVVAVDGQDHILLGNGSGGFTMGTSLPGICAFGDFNGDANLDALYSTTQSSTLVTVLVPGNGDATFGAEQVFSGLSILGAPTTGDWDDDGITDLAFSYLSFAGSTKVDILYGDAATPFSRTDTVTVYNGSGGFASLSGSGDFNGDGLPDIATLARFDSNGLVTYVTLLNNSANPGQFSVGPSFTVQLSPQGGGGFQIADFNGDGNADVLVPGGAIQFSIWFGGVAQSSAYYLNPAEANGNARRYGNLFLPATAFMVGDFSATPDGIADLALIAEIGASLWESQAGNSYDAPTLTANNLMLEQAGPFLNVLLGNYSSGSVQRVALSFKAPVTWTDFEYGIFSASNFDLSNGQVQANLRAACSLAPGSYPDSVFLTVANPGGLASQVTLPLTVTSNATPTLGNYLTTNVALAGSVAVTPDAAPADTGSTPTLDVTASINFTGSLSVNQTTGVVTISNAAPLGTHTITITATDNCGATVMRSFQLNVSSTTQTQTHLANGPNPSAYDQLVSFTATVISNGNPVTAGTITFKEGTTVLTNVTLNGGNVATFATFALSPGAHTITAEYSGTSQFEPSQDSVTHNVSCPTITVNPLTLPAGQVGMVYAQTITAQPSGGNYSYQLDPLGSPPSWLQIDAVTGVLTGTPTTAGTFNFTVRVNGFNSCAESRPYTLVIGQLNLTATGGEGSVDLNWTHAGYSTLTGFKLYRATTISGPYTLVQTLAANANTFRDTAVTINTTYFYKLTVLDSHGESSFSNPAAATPVAGEPPVITHIPPAAPTTPGVPVAIQATATDDVGVQSVKLFFRTIGAASYTERALTGGSNNLYQTTIQASEVAVPGVEYYLEARDQSSATLAGQPNNPYRLTLADRPYLTQLNPANGPAAGGTTVTITGHNFKANAVVRFDNALATITSQSATQLVCTTPPHFPAAVDVRVTNPDGASDLLARGFTYQGTQATLSLPTTGGPQGINVLIPINAANVQGLTAADVRVTFNSAILNAVNVSLGTLTPNWSMQTNLNTPGEVRLALASTSGPISGSGSIAVIEFQVLGTSGAVTPLTLDSVLLNGGAISATLTAGQFTVAQKYSISGTINHWNNVIGTLSNVTLALTGTQNYSTTSQANGAFSLGNVLGGDYTLTPGKTDQTSGISAFDAALVLQHSAGLITLTGAALTAADVDRSSGVNSQDAFYILQQTVGLIGLPFPGASANWLFNPTTRSYSNLNNNQTNQDFTGILLGDVNGSFTNGNRPVSPATLATLSLPELSVPAGAEFSALLTLVAPPGQVLSAELQLTYDANVFTVLAVENGSLTNDWLRAVNLTTPGLIRVALAGSRAVASSGDLLRLRLRATGAVGRSSAFAFTQGRLNEGGISATLTPGRISVRARAATADFNLDGKTDLTVWRGVTGEWFTARDGNSTLPPIVWGSSNAPYNDVLAPGDYDGDGQADVAIWRPLDGGWYILGSLTGAISQRAWGQRGDIPVPGDYDNDGKTDLAVWRPSDSNWYILKSSDNQFIVQAWGSPNAPYNDVAVPADYDGDGKTDLAVFRRQTGVWYVRKSSDGQILAQNWGLGTDVPVPGDYDGDGKTDFAVWRGNEGNWYVRMSGDGQFLVRQWGTAALEDVPVPGDYDGDGRTDVAVFRRTNGTWYIHPGNTTPPIVKPWGLGTDTPVPGHLAGRN